MADKNEERNVINKYQDVSTNRRKRVTWESMLAQQRGGFARDVGNFRDLKIKLSNQKSESRNGLQK